MIRLFTIHLNRDVAMSCACASLSAVVSSAVALASSVSESENGGSVVVSQPHAGESTYYNNIYKGLPHVSRCLVSVRDVLSRVGGRVWRAA